MPKQRAKNKRAHIVHLAPAARAILDELPQFADADGVESDLVFTTNGRTSVSGFTRAKNKLDEKLEEAPAKEAAAAGKGAPNPGARVAATRLPADCRDMDGSQRGSAARGRSALPVVAAMAN